MTTLGAVRKLVAQMRRELAAGKGWNYAEYEKGRIVEKQRCLSLLEAALAQAPAVRVDDVLLRVSDEDLRWCKDVIGALQEAGGPTNNMRAVGLSRLIAALEAALAQQPAPSAPVGVEGLMQLARNWCLAWGEWAHDADPGCAKENAAEAELRAALTTALAQQPAACPRCDGTGEADSGGIMPWGAPAMIPCDCQQPAACDMGALCIGCEPRNADGSCPGTHVAAKTRDSDNV